MAKSSKQKISRRPGTTRRQMETAKSAPVDLKVEYAYVAQDLSRIGIIAGILIGLLVVLSFFL